MTTIDTPVSELTPAAYRAVLLFAQLDPPLTYDAIGEQVGKDEREVRTIIGVACNGNRAKAREYIRTHMAPESPLTAPIKAKPKRVELRTEVERAAERIAAVVPAATKAEPVEMPEGFDLPAVDDGDLDDIRSMLDAAYNAGSSILAEKAKALMAELAEVRQQVVHIRRRNAVAGRKAALQAELDALDAWERAS